MEAVKNLNGEMWIFAGLLIGIVIVPVSYTHLTLPTIGG